MSVWLFSIIGGTLLSTLAQVYTVDASQLIDRDALMSRSHSTWEGTYRFMEDRVLSIEGLPDLHVLVYRNPDHEGSLIDFAESESEDRLRLLREAATNVRGVTPILEAIDVLLVAHEAEIIVRWHHPGNGGLLTLEKYLYSPGKLEYVNGSEYRSTWQDGRKMKWFKH